MRFNNLLSDDAVTEEIGRRIAAARVERQLTQADLAKAAGISKRTVERLEDGAATQLDNLVRCLRVLDRLEGLERLLPDTAINPIELLRGHRGQRTRVRHARGHSSAGEPAKGGWTWGDQK